MFQKHLEEFDSFCFVIILSIYVAGNVKSCKYHPDYRSKKFETLLNRPPLQRTQQTCTWNNDKGNQATPLFWHAISGASIDIEINLLCITRLKFMDKSKIRSTQHVKAV